MNGVVIFLFFFFRFTQESASQGTADSFYYDACVPSMCGDVAVAFPFSSSEAFCGLPGFVIACNASSSLATITLSGRPYRVNAIYNYREGELLLTVSDLELAGQIRSNSCTAAAAAGGGGGGGGLREHFLPQSSFGPFRPFDGYAYLNFTWCDRGQVPPNSVNLLADCPGRNNASGSLLLLPPGGPLNNDSELPSGCDHATLPVLQQQLNLPGKDVTHRGNLSDVIDQGFGLVSAEWDKNFAACSSCQAAGGRCGYNQSSGEQRCFCRGTCGGEGNDNDKFSWKIIVAIVTPTTILLVAGLIAFTKFRSSLFGILIKPSSDNSNVKEFISTYKSTLTTEYSYSDLKRIIGRSKEKLGEGGYGNVYKGKLQNGLPVAVKILEKSKDDSQQDFINEVATIGQIHHVNVIRLLGFCCDGPHRALIYELMDKGSLAKLISNEEMTRLVGAQRLLEIALGIARGVEYLHNGCERRILHLDIKPQNVLLDNNFHPKISDFGLAKLQSRKESTVTLTGARGTIGYIAPEVFMRSLGGVSHKSDVYSFGMLLLKMALGKASPESVSMQEVGSNSDKYFPDWIYDQLHEWQGLDSGLVEVEENQIWRKLAMVGLWCIQANPVSRPSIGKAIEMLRGEVMWIEMPPKPLLFSLPDQQQSGHGSQTAYFSIECSSL
ncbi:rust resistance kinase Lr10-like [Curcuma longa]|uniref:rust resistance kinase Lr10-like n=1 Tax=Curcuma longa TaxID=136217 RepID=UPI003D9E7C76